VGIRSLAHDGLQQAIEFRAGGGRRHAAPEESNDVHGVAGAAQREGIERERVVHLGIELGSGLDEGFEIRREHADHGEVRVIQVEDASQDVGVRAELPRPVAMTENERDAAAGLLFPGQEVAAKLHAHAERIEEIVVDAEAAQHLGRAVLEEDAGAVAKRRHALERTAVLAHLARCGVVHARVLGSGGGGFGDGGQAIGFGVGQRVQQDGFDDAEDGGVRAHAQGQREHGDRREGGVARQRAQPETDVLAKRFERRKRVHLHYSLMQQGRVANRGL
jgi:hypothetical protein